MFLNSTAEHVELEKSVFNQFNYFAAELRFWKLLLNDNSVRNKNAPLRVNWFFFEFFRPAFLKLYISFQNYIDSSER